MKTLGIPGFIAVFFVAYFLLQDFPLFPVTIMPVTAPDRWIGFHPWAIVPYFSLWVYVSIPPSLTAGRREVFAYLWACVAMSLVAMLVFLFWPTARPDFAIDWARYPTFAFLKSVDLARNALPSLHAAFSIFSGFWLARQLREIRAPRLVRAVNVLWCLGILYSTIATRQHVALDIYAGGALGVATFVIHRQCLLRPLRGLRYHRRLSRPAVGARERAPGE